MLKDIERCFTRAVIHTFDKKKILFTLPFLFLCGVSVVFCKSLSFFANSWIMFCLIFLPIFFSSTILYILGVFLVKIYYSEVKNLKSSYFDIFKKSFKSIEATLHISIPPFIIFFLLWIIFGLFVAIKGLPYIGNFIGVMLSIIPFIIILCSILLLVFNLIALFFVVPAIALKEKKRFDLVKEVMINLKKNLLLNITFFISSIFLIFLVILILITSFFLTKVCFSIPLDNIYVGFQWFFVMIPFTIFVAPLVIFFFNVALETYNLVQIKDRK